MRVGRRAAPRAEPRDFFDLRHYDTAVPSARSLVRSGLILAGILAAPGRPAIVAAQAPAPAVGPSATTTRETLDRFCVRCHNQRSRTAGLALDATDLSAVSADAETWERVLVKLRAQTMPPAGGPRPDAATYRAVATWLETEIDAVALAHPDPGRGETFHRLNRAEYHASVRDLLAIDVDVYRISYAG